MLRSALDALISDLTDVPRVHHERSSSSSLFGSSPSSVVRFWLAGRDCLARLVPASASLVLGLV